MRARLVVAAGGVQQQVDGWLADHPQGARAVVAEGVFAAIEVPPAVAVARLAAGCVCCLGRTPLRVTLLRTPCSCCWCWPVANTWIGCARC
jgi:hypothetical protein